jgi:hypothetical protein
MATGGTVTGRTTSLTFWWTMTAIDLALVWGFSAYTALCFARIILLTK